MMMTMIRGTTRIGSRATIQVENVQKMRLLKKIGINSRISNSGFQTKGITTSASKSASTITSSNIPSPILDRNFRYSSRFPFHLNFYHTTTTTATATTKIRFLSTSTSSSSSPSPSPEENENKEEKEEELPLLLYESPMGGLISRLKIVSITSCVMSIVGLPIMIYIKNGGYYLPTMQQVGMGGIAFLSATGSTIALHFVFGPYILDLYQIPPPSPSSTTTTTENENEKDNKDVLLYKATTRSVFGWKKEYIFNPQTDVQPYSGGLRPFANFMIRDKSSNNDTAAAATPLYAHPELLQGITKSMLLGHLEQQQKQQQQEDEDKNTENDATFSTNADVEESGKSSIHNHDTRDDAILEKKKKAASVADKNKQKKDDDDFF